MFTIEPELKEYYDNYFALFSSDGWKQLEKEVVENISNLEKSTLQQGDTDVFLRNSGYIAALKYVVTYPKLVESTWEDINKTEEPE